MEMIVVSLMRPSLTSRRRTRLLVLDKTRSGWDVSGGGAQETAGSRIVSSHMR